MCKMSKRINSDVIVQSIDEWSEKYSWNLLQFTLTLLRLYYSFLVSQGANIACGSVPFQLSGESF